MTKLILPKFWYRRGIISYLLWPFTPIYRMFVYWYRRYFQFIRYIIPLRLGVPVVIVGNITVGGAGKTPLVIYLANLLQKHGYSPGIVSRGYGRSVVQKAVSVDAMSKVEEVGDEALLLVKHAICPMVVARDRVMAAKTLLKQYKCNVIISDDGLQHYSLHRDIEIIVMDEEFGFGNQFCLPAGPLREPITRLRYGDFIVKNHNTRSLPDIKTLPAKEYCMKLKSVGFYNLKNPELIVHADTFKNKVIHAVAGLGRPERFFQSLREMGLKIIIHPFPDHHIFKESDLAFDSGIVIMTEKDAVKCMKMAHENFWYLPVVAQLSEIFTKDFLGVLKSKM